jgi:hypothetical protein
LDVAVGEASSQSADNSSDAAVVVNAALQQALGRLAGVLTQRGYLSRYALIKNVMKIKTGFCYGSLKQCHTKLPMALPIITLNRPSTTQCGEFRDESRVAASVAALQSR